MPERPGVHPESGDARMLQRTETPVGQQIHVEALFQAITEIAEAAVEADWLLFELAREIPKVKEILSTPQSPDKHAEGPTVQDHYRSILSAINLLRHGQMPYDRAREVLGLEDAEQEWKEVEAIVRDHPNLLIAFAFMHDVAKPDTLGFVVRDGSPAISLGFATKAVDKEIEKRRDKAREAAVKRGDESLREAFVAEQTIRRADLRAKYDKLFTDFATTHQGITPMELQAQFFDAYGISINYRGHAEAAYNRENRDVVRQVANHLGLTQEERRLLRFAIEQHINPLMKFERVEGKYIQSFVEAAEQLDLDPQKAMRVLQAGLLVDGVIGTVKLPTRIETVNGQEVKIPETSGTPYIHTGPLINFWKSEKLYPAYRKEEDAKEQRRLVLIEEGLTGEAMRTLGFPEGPETGKILGMIREAIRGDGTLPFVADSEIRGELEARVSRAKVRIAKIEGVG